EVPSPVTGILKEILAADGTTVPSGGEIAVVELEGADGASAPQAAPPAAAAPAEPKEPPPEPEAQAEAEGDKSETGEHRYSPAVRMLAEEKHVDLNSITGSGLGGRVTKKDVEAAAAGRATAPAEQAAAAPAPAAPPPPAQLEGDEKVPLSRIKRLVGENMARSKSTIPHAWQTQEVDMSGVVANRSANKGKFAKVEGYSLTYLPYVVMAAAVALREHPDVNATFGGDS